MNQSHFVSLKHIPIKNRISMIFVSYGQIYGLKIVDYVVVFNFTNLK